MSKTIITKQCSKCKQSKPLSEFHRNRSKKDGYHNQCKICRSVYAKSDKAKLHQKKYQQSQKGKSTYCKVSRNYRINNPEKTKARHSIDYAKTSGKLSHPDTLQCNYCPNQAQEYHHYLDYEPEHRLDVQPVCKKCHYKIHSLL